MARPVREGRSWFGARASGLLTLLGARPTIRTMERIVHKSRSFEEAAEWDVEQQVAMTPQERMRAAHELKRRAFPRGWKGVREWARKK